ncbi:MAG TPA: sugar O-acetyltransferase [Paludibacteraceae bacterium]|nr:sugar O-acetyltransferase [Paludibacteraceae bacterium]HOU67197.1 sugar O-acetyltransferase [Paludibacteraceae bacterium]HQF50805.1 sugar O-acetyltransferase [Paludibacteraceae bacterium]HQJ89272.1 sugar O-acetyltransferase [Paludibacteraceae bacterium]
MTEKEKASAGLLYDANYDETLMQERIRCKDLCMDYNQLRFSQFEEQKALIKKLLGNVSEGFYITPPFWCDYGYNIEIGKNFYTNHNCVILDAAKVQFGDNVFIGPNCIFSTSGHPIDSARRNQGIEYAYPITVGNDVWFGANVTVLPGVSIGDNVVIGAGSVVTKDIPSGVIAVGNPCRILRKITPEDAEKYKTRQP